MLGGFSEGQRRGTADRVRRVPKSQRGPVLDMGKLEAHFISF